MAYQRKTKDEYEIQQNFGYGDGWESVTTEETWSAAKEQRKCYQENQPEFPVRIVKHRITKED
jgi:hypothetical protein